VIAVVVSKQEEITSVRKENKMQTRSADELVQRITANPNLVQDVKTDPVTTLKTVADQVVRDLPPALQTDRWIYRIVVSVLGLVVLAAIIGAILLGYQWITIPETLTALGSAAVGALAGLLAPSPAQQTH
jgi:hypothetical protein